MSDLKNLGAIQSELTKSNVDGWIVPDYRGSNEIFSVLVDGSFHLTRRAILFIPTNGEPIAFVHIIDKPHFVPAEKNFVVEYYRTWKELLDWYNRILSPLSCVVTEYSQNCAIPTMSQVDGGTLDVIRKYVKVESSADIFQKTVSAWTLEDYDGHVKSVEETVKCLRSALEFVKTSLTNGTEITEMDVQNYIVKEFVSHGIETYSPPIVAVSPNNGNPHYDPDTPNNTVITKDNLLLIDLWAILKEGKSVYSDITYMSYFGDKIPAKIIEVFNVVRDARNAAINFVKENISSGIQGYQVDDVSRKVISDAGYGDYFLHRTGHSMGPGNFLHARGVNIDNFETHDEREVTPMIGFSIEPGIYLPEFGIRSEIDMFIHPDLGPIVTTPLQEEIEHFVI